MPENMNVNNYNEGYQEPVMAPGCPGGQLYTVKSGDTLFFIARRFNISLQSLISANPQILDPNTIYPGQVICIPVGRPGPGVPCPDGRIYRVVSGDTMFEIARRFGVTLDALIQANPQITNPDLIFPGQEICVPVSVVPVPCPVVPVPCPGGTLYMVKKGDTLFEIAKMNGISLAALIMANPQIPDPNLIYPGQTICVPRTVMEKPIPLPMPMPMPEPEMPVPPVTSPIVSPPPSMPSMPSMPPMMPCPPAGPMTQPMPVYIVIPWEECPYRCPSKKKRVHHRKGCR